MSGGGTPPKCALPQGRRRCTASPEPASLSHDHLPQRLARHTAPCTRPSAFIPACSIPATRRHGDASPMIDARAAPCCFMYLPLQPHPVSSCIPRTTEVAHSMEGSGDGRRNERHGERGAVAAREAARRHCSWPLSACCLASTSNPEHSTLIMPQAATMHSKVPWSCCKTPCVTRSGQELPPPSKSGGKSRSLHICLARSRSLSAFSLVCLEVPQPSSVSVRPQAPLERKRRLRCCTRSLVPQLCTGCRPAQGALRRPA